MKNKKLFITQKPAATPTFCKRNFSQIYQKKVMIFFSFSLRLGNQHFVSKKYVNQNIFKNKVCIGCRHDLKQLLTPKKIMDHYRFFSPKLVRFGMIWVSVPKIDLWGIFPTQFSSLSWDLWSIMTFSQNHRILKYLML